MNWLQRVMLGAAAAAVLIMVGCEEGGAPTAVSDQARKAQSPHDAVKTLQSSSDVAEQKKALDDLDEVAPGQLMEIVGNLQKARRKVKDADLKKRLEAILKRAGV